MRDYIDTRFSLGEFLLPSLVVILALSFLTAVYPTVSAITTIVMYVFILAVLVDCYFLWRGFKRVLADRLPGRPDQRPDDVRREPLHPDPPVPDARPAAQARRHLLSVSRSRPVGATPRAGVSAPTA